jgi:hypothetical protein
MKGSGVKLIMALWDNTYFELALLYKEKSSVFY